jgi:hypothetical protein
LYGAPNRPLSDVDRALLALDPASKRQLVRLVANLQGK